MVLYNQTYGKTTYVVSDLCGSRLNYKVIICTETRYSQNDDLQSELGEKDPDGF